MFVMKEIGIGLLGFGTVGAGVVEGLQKNGDLIADRLGIRLVLRQIADLDLDTDRGVEVSRDLLTPNAADVIANPCVDVVVELIGGTGVALDLVKQALEAGKPVVTANKALLAEHGEEIYSLADARNVDICFGASVGGGIPIIRALREGLIGNRIERIDGILNGTCNYILTRMQAEPLPFQAVLDDAQAAGYAEADPSLDIDGVDTAHKAVILASLAYGACVPMAAVHVEGIRHLEQMDIECAARLGYGIKLLAVVNRAGKEVEVRVHPALVPTDHLLASVGGVFNAVMVRGDFVGDALFYGRGAGRGPTASTVLGDIADVARNLAADTPRRVAALPRSGQPVTIRAMADIVSRYYLRMAVVDKPGVLAGITDVLGRHGISIASVLQKDARAGEVVQVVIVTHEAVEHSIDLALGEIDGMDAAASKTVRYRIEEGER
jgi:homoserine dehydrogenase